MRFVLVAIYHRASNLRHDHVLIGGVRSELFLKLSHKTLVLDLLHVCVVAEITPVKADNRILILVTNVALILLTQPPVVACINLEVPKLLKLVFIGVLVEAELRVIDSPRKNKLIRRTISSPSKAATGLCLHTRFAFSDSLVDLIL